VYGIRLILTVLAGVFFLSIYEINNLEMWTFQIVGNGPNKSNIIHEEIKSRLKSGNACYHLVQNVCLLSLLSKNIKIKIYMIITLPVALYGCGPWSLTLREERRLRMFEKRLLEKIVGGKGGEVTGE
jgi:hypothetical protein